MSDIFEKIRAAKVMAAEKVVIEDLREKGLIREPHIMRSDPPKRCYEITIKVGADNWEYAKQELQQVINHIEEHGADCKSVSGSPSTNHIVEIHHDPEMTHDRYFELLQPFVDHRA